MSERPKFDLQKALAGAPIETRDGRKAGLIGHAPNLDEDCRVLYWVDGFSFPFSCGNDGDYFMYHEESEHDLFMAPQTKTLWVVVYYRVKGHEISYLHQTKAEADAHRGQCIDCGVTFAGTYPLEIDV